MAFQKNKIRTQTRKSAALFVFAAAFLIFRSAPASADVTNVLSNPSFEEVLGDTVGTGNWNSESNRGISRVASPGTNGNFVMRLSEPGTVNAGFGGVFTFQTVAGTVKTGDVVGFSADVRINTANGGDAVELRLEFQTGAGALISAETVAVPTGATTTFSRFSVSGVAPSGTGQVTFVVRLNPATSGENGGLMVADIDNAQGTFATTPLFLEATPSSASMQPGSMKMIAMRLNNRSTAALAGVEVVADPPPGINIRAEGGNLNGRKLGSREGSVIFSVGTLVGGQESLLSFPIILTSGAVSGKSYDIEVFARATSGEATQTIHILIRSELDPVFDEGTILGKVFNDTNRNGAQDKGEEGVPWVRLATEEGIIVVTDENGKYYIPAVKPGRHIVKIDGHTLPDGTEFITEESVLVKTTPGLMNKASFAVVVPPSELPKQFQKELMVSVAQGLDLTPPTLEVLMDPDVVRVGVKKFEREPSFRFRMNYPEFIKNWYLEIRDEMGRPVWTGFGLGAPPEEVVWAGQTEGGEFINPGVYSYQLKVEDQKGYQDWTALHFFRVIQKSQSYDAARFTEIPPIGDFNIFKDGKRSIPLVAKPTLQIQGKTKKENQVKINGYEVNVDPETGHFQTQIYVSPGEKVVNVTTTSPEGENTTFTKKVKVKESTFFMVALGEEQLGVNFQDGNADTFGQDDLYKRGIYEDGRLSYYLKGKIKGKFLVKSHFDTDETRSALFRNLDQDNYYPIYGDNSSRDYEALDTRDRFYMVIEMDRSFLKYGSFKTAFTDTELATYNRTLSGLKIHHESINTTAYGDPKRGVKVFWSEARHKADHNEFAATGGSLYYLRNRNAIEGSEKIRVEVRDRIQDITVESVDVQEGQDYEIDYPEGRIILTKPLSSVAASDTLVSHDILDGSPVYLIVDYEYDAGASAFEDTNRGVRGYTHMGDHIRIGATGVEEKRQGGDHDLRGIDATVKMGRNTKVTAEYAETHLKQTNNALSYNGGLSFANLEPLQSVNAQPRENAYLIKGESKPIENVEVSGYLQGVDPGFSTDRIRSQEGYRKHGAAARYKVSDNFYLRYRYDASDLENELMPLQFVNVNAPYQRLRTNTVQAVYNDDLWLAEAEYRKQSADIPFQNLSPTLLSEIPFEDGIATKLGYRLNDRLMPYVKAQAGFNGKANNQFGGGVRYQIMKNLYGYIEEMVGNIGDSTRFGFEQYRGNSRSYASLKMLDFGGGSKNFATTIGNSRQLSEKSRIYSEREYSSYDSHDGYAEIVGYDKQINDYWSFDAKGERRHLDNATTRLLDNAANQSLVRTNTFNSVSGGIGYKDGKKLKVRTALEFRKDQDAPKISQWLTQNNLEYLINPDLSFLGKLNYGKSRFMDPSGTPAAFTELSTGFAYRPIENDKLNILTRYTLLRNLGNDLQFASALFGGIETDQTDHIFAIDIAWDLFKYLGMVDKFAYKHTQMNTNVTEEAILHQMLAAHRFNYHVTRKWDVALEYRALMQFDVAQTLKHGFLTEVDREIYDYVRLGVGYNFTDFDDDLRKSNNYNSHGPFVRMTGKF